MKALRLFLLFLLAVVVTTAVLSFMQSTSQKVVRSVTIKASPPTIYNELIKLETFNKFSIWSQSAQDSSAIYKITGTDGTVGAATTWKGAHEISGEGKIEIAVLEPNRKIVHWLEFTQPKKGKARSEFTLVETERNVTTVTWTFNLATPRPWNIFNLFYSLDKEKGKDFEEGLATLKLLMESRQ